MLCKKQKQKASEYLKSICLECNGYETRLVLSSELIQLFLTFGCKIINANILKNIKSFPQRINLH